MRIEYDTNLEDMEYVFQRVHDRLSRHSPFIRRARRRSLLFTVGVGAVVCFFLVPGSYLARSIAAATGALLALLLWRPAHRRNITRSVKAVAREHGSPGHFFVELTDVGVLTSEFDGDVLIPWSQIASIEETPRSIDFWTTSHGLVSVNRRAFADASELAAFLRLAETLGGRSPQDASGRQGSAT